MSLLWAYEKGLFLFYTSVYIHIVSWEHGIIGYIYMTTIDTLLHKQFLVVHIIYNIDGYNYQLLHATSSLYQRISANYVCLTSNINIFSVLTTIPIISDINKVSIE